VYAHRRSAPVAAVIVALATYTVAGCGAGEGETDEERLRQETAQVASDLCYALDVDELAAALGTDATVDDVSRAVGRRSVGAALLSFRADYDAGGFDLPPRAVTDQIALDAARNCETGMKLRRSAR
jgi:hypothetical protein